MEDPALWRDSPREPANKQRLLFDPIREGEKVLHYLENEPPPAVFAQLLAAAAAAVGHLYASVGFVHRLWTSVDP